MERGLEQPFERFGAQRRDHESEIHNGPILYDGVAAHAPTGSTCALHATRSSSRSTLPCLNEAETLAGCIDKARRTSSALGIAGEVMVADNGSTDGSQEIARPHGARVVDVPDRGYGAR